MSKIDKAAERIAALVDKEGSTKNMTLREYVEFLGQVIQDAKEKRRAAENDLARQNS